MHSPVQRAAFHPSYKIRSETSPPPCSQKYAVKCVLSLIYSLWQLTNSMVPQPTVRMVRDWMCQPMESGAVGFRRPTLMWEYSTPTPPLTETRHQYVAVYRKEAQTWEEVGLPAVDTIKRWNTPPLPPLSLSFQPQEVYMGNEVTTFYKHLTLLLAQK